MELTSRESEGVTASVPVLVITGPVGVGKTTLAAAVSHLLGEAATPHAMVDMDSLRWCYPSPAHDPFHTALGLQNLAAVWASFQAAGAERLILADVVESREELAGYRIAMPGAAILVVRLRAALPAILRRLEGRDSGASLAWHRERAAVLVAQMERDRVEDLLVETEGKTVADLAREILTAWRGRVVSPRQ